MRSATTPLILGLLLCVSTLSGCSEQSRSSSFVYSDVTQSLIREARRGTDGLNGVEQLVDERFGTPQDLKAWTQLPIQFGGVSGKVGGEPDASAAVKELQLALDEDFAAFPAGPDDDSVHLLQFVTGEAAGETAAIVAWDPDTSTAILEESLSVVPASGDQVVINGGSGLQHGRTLYQRHCSHCHGTSGDGNGPTAPYLNPRPRDYRHGVFKFTSTDGMAKARRDDIRRILEKGVPGTYMPSFVPMLDEQELSDVVEYVRFLSMRGEFERRVATELKQEYSQEAVAARRSGDDAPRYSEIVEELRTFLDEDMPDSLEFISDDMATRWSAAEEAVLIPGMNRVPDSPESRRIGRELYLSKAINCANCHGVSGYGDGPQTMDFEKDPETGEKYPEPGLHNIWGGLNQPRNLVQGVYRGGRRPIDIYYRIHAGIKGTRMPSFRTLSDEQIWHIVNYVLSIPFEIEPGKGVSDVIPADAVAAAE